MQGREFIFLGGAAVLLATIVVANAQLSPPTLLPEYSVSPDRHFDAVRPMNHAYVIPNGYVQKNGFPPQMGPDANQINAWALK